MVKYVGLSNQEAIKKIEQNAQNQVNDLLERFDKNIEVLTDNTKTFWENAFGVVSLIPAGAYNVINGGLESVLSSAQGIFTILANSVNDIKHMITADSFEDFAIEREYAIKNLYASVQEGISSSLLSFVDLGADLVESGASLFGEDIELLGDDWFQKEMEKVSNKANRTRGDVLRKKEENQFGFNTDEQLVKSRYSQDFLNTIEGSIDVKNWVSKNIVKPLAFIAQPAGKTATDYTQELWGDSKLYQTYIGTAESVGGILASWAIAKFAKKANLSASTAKTISSTFFASKVFGQSFEEAYKNGADFQDAYTFAMGNALLETALENVGGFDTSGATVTKKSFFEKIIKNEKWANIVGNMVEEGLEEVGAEVFGRGLEYYKTEDNKIEDRNMADFWSNAGFAFLGGALASFGLGVGQSAYINTTVESKASKIFETWDKSVLELGETESVKRLENDVDKLLKTLNNPFAQGQKQKTEKSGVYVGKLSQEEKLDFINKNKLNQLITYNEETKQFEKSKEFEKIDANFFKNTIKTDAIDSEKYAISSGTIKTDISDGGRYNVLEVEKMNDRRKEIYNLLIKNKKISIAMIELENDNTNAFYSGRNNVIYMNAKAVENMSNQEIEDKLTRHENVHHMKKVAPTEYAEITKDMDKLVNLGFDIGNRELTINYKDAKTERQLKPILDKENIKSKLNQTFAERYEAYTEKGDSQAIEKATADTYEELMAYAIENFLQGGKFIDAISRTDKTFFEKVKNFFTNQDTFLNENIKSKKLRNELKRMRTKFEQSSARLADIEKSLYRYTSILFAGENAFEKFYNKDLVEKYGLDTIQELVAEAFMNAKYTIEIDGNVYDIVSEVFAISKDYEVKKSIKSPTQEDLRKNFKYNKKDNAQYLKEIKKHNKELRILLKDLVNNNKYETEEYLDIDRKLGMSEDIIDALQNNDALQEDEINFIADLILSLGATDTKAKKQIYQKTIEAEANNSIIKKIVRMVQDRTVYKDIKNNAYNVNYYGATLVYKHEETTAKEIQKELNVVLSALDTALRTQVKTTAPFTEKDFYFVEKTDIESGLSQITILASEELLQKKTEEIRLKNQEKEEKIEVKTETQIRQEENAERISMIEQDMLDYISANINIDLSNKNIIKIDSNTKLEDIEKLEYNDNNIVVGIPRFHQNEIEILNKSLEKASTVAIILPNTFAGSYINQSKINNNAKLIYSEKQGQTLVKVEHKTRGEVSQNYKIVAQVWTTENTKQKDLRLSSAKPSVHNDFNVMNLSGNKNNFDKAKDLFKDGKLDFDFAIIMRSDDIREFSKRITDFNDLQENKIYSVIKANNQNTLDILNTIDFQKLAESGSYFKLGFTTYDLVEAYKNRKQEMVDLGVKFSTNKDSTNIKLTDAVVEYFKNAYTHDRQKRIARLFHGTNTGGFRIFNPSVHGYGNYLFGDAIINFFTDNELIASSYSDNSKEIIPTTPEEIRDHLEKVLNSDINFYSAVSDYGYITDETKKKIYALVDGDYYTLGKYKSKNEIIEKVYKREIDNSKFFKKGIYQVYTNITKPYIVDAHGNNWDSIYIKQDFSKIQKIWDNFSDFVNNNELNFEDILKNPDFIREKIEKLGYTFRFFNELNAEEQANAIDFAKGTFRKYDTEEKVFFDNDRYGTRYNLITEEQAFIYKGKELFHYLSIDNIFRKRKEINFADNFVNNDGDIYNLITEEQEFISDSKKKANLFLELIEKWIETGLFQNRFTTNEIVMKILESNARGETDYDGIIIKKVFDVGGFNDDFIDEDNADEYESTIYITIKSPNQVKSVYNLNPTLDLDILKSIPHDTKLTQPEKDNISRLFNDNTIAEMFERARNGAFVLKNKFIPTKAKSGKLKIGGINYNTLDYAIHITNNIDDYDIKRSDIPIKLTELDKIENRGLKMIYDVIKTTKLNFIMYKGNNRDNSIGYSVGGSKANVVFLNTTHLNAKNFLEVLIHEHTHEIFKVKTLDAIAFGKEYAKILFTKENGKVVATAIMDEIQQQFAGMGDFYNYFNNFYGSQFMRYRTISNDNDLYNLLTANIDPNVNIVEYNTINEITAQFTGKLFADKDFFNRVVGKSNSISASFLNIYTKIIDNPSIAQSVKTYLKTQGDYLSDLFDKYLTQMSKIFPDKKIYTTKELNDFIKVFTDGQFTTKKKLMDAYLIERAKNTKGDATYIIDNLIRIAGMFQKNVQVGSLVFDKLRKEFIKFQSDVRLVVENETEVLKINSFVKITKEIVERMKTMEAKRKISNDGYTFDSLNELHELILDFYAMYDTTNADLLAIFDFPTKAKIEKASVEALGEIELLVEYIVNNEHDADFRTNLNKHINVLKSKLTDLVKQFANIKKISAKDGLFGRILVLQENYRESLMNNFISTLKTRTRNKVDNLTTKAPANEDLENVGRIIDDVIRILEKNTKNFRQLTEEAIPKILELKDFITQSERISPEIKSQLDRQIFSIFKNLAGLTGYTAFLRRTYPSDPFVKNSPDSVLLKDAKASQVANAFVSILDAFKSVYKTSFGNGNIPHDEYSKTTVGQIRGIEAPLKTVLSNFKSYIQTPQEYFRELKEIFPEVQFFKDLYDAYIETNKRRENIIMDFNNAYIEWNKNNPDLQEYSLEKVGVSGIVEMRQGDIEIINNKVAETIAEQKKVVKKLREESKELKKEKTVLKSLLKQKILEISLEPDFTLKKRQLINERKQLEKQIAEKIKQIKDKNKAIKKETTILDNYNEKHMFQEEFFKANPDVNLNNPVEMQRGVLISIYLSIIREKEMQEAYNNDGKLMPTNHLNFKSMFHTIDNEVSVKKGWAKAKAEAVPYLIMEDIDLFLGAIEKVLLNDDKTMAIIDFVRTQLDWSYEQVDEVYFGKNDTHLIRQQNYFPFRTLESDYARMFDIKKANSYNLGVADGFVRATTEGANTPLAIENVFNVLEKYIVASANYSLERMITDFQNLVVNKASGTNLEIVLQGKGNKLGELDLLNFFEKVVGNILNYKSAMDSLANRFIKFTTDKVVQATVIMNIPIIFKQLASVATIALKNQISFDELAKNVAMSIVGGNANFRRWLMKNNGNFHLRAESFNIPNLSEKITPDAFTKFKKKGKRALDFLSFPVGWVDNAVLVGAFKTIYDVEKKLTPLASEAELLESTNKKFYDVLLYGVANTNTAYRSQFSNEDNALLRSASRFQSENTLQISALIRIFYKILNGIEGSWKELVRHLSAFLASGLFTAFVSSIANNVRGYADEENPELDFIINEFLWENVVGGVPILNTLTSMIRWTFDHRWDNNKTGVWIEEGFEPKAPVLSNFSNILTRFSKLTGKYETDRVHLMKMLEESLQMIGVPLKNTNRLITSFTNLLDNKTTSEISRFYSSRTKQQQLNKAIKERKQSVVRAYTEEAFDNNRVKEEIVNLMLRNPDEKINMYLGVKSFKKLENDVYVNYKIPQEKRDKYNSLAQKTMRKVILQAIYKKLTDIDKIKVLQRIINYYNNYMKEDILTKNKKELKTILDDDAVIKNALNIKK